jgi:hypothetical protein
MLQELPQSIAKSSYENEGIAKQVSHRTAWTASGRVRCRLNEARRNQEARVLMGSVALQTEYRGHTPEKFDKAVDKVQGK